MFKLQVSHGTMKLTIKVDSERPNASKVMVNTMQICHQLRPSATGKITQPQEKQSRKLEVLWTKLMLHHTGTTLQTILELSEVLFATR